MSLDVAINEVDLYFIYFFTLKAKSSEAKFNNDEWKKKKKRADCYKAES